MDKQALPDFLRDIGDRASDAGSSLTDWYAKLNPEIKNTLLRGLVGGATAGAGITALRHFTPRDPEESVSSHTLKPALLAALLGGGSAAALPIGVKLMTGRNSAFSQRDAGGLTGAATNAVTGPLVSNLGVTAGAAAGAYPTLFKGLFADEDAKPTFGTAFRRDFVENWRGQHPRAQFRQEHDRVMSADPVSREARAKLVAKARKLKQLEASMTPGFRNILKEPAQVAGRTGRNIKFNAARLAEALRGLSGKQIAALGLIPAGALAGKAVENLIKGE